MIMFRKFCELDSVGSDDWDPDISPWTPSPEQFAPLAFGFGAPENARRDIARLDNAAPYRKGGHHETCFSVRVDAH